MSVFRRAMVYLGLVDDDYDDYQPYDDSQPVAPARPPRPTAPMDMPESRLEQAGGGGGGGIRTLPREQVGTSEGISGVTVQPRPAVVRPIVAVQSKGHRVEP